MNTIEEAARRLAQLRSSGVDTPLELATRPATPALDVGTEAHEAAAPGPEVLSRLQAQWAGQRPAPSQHFYDALTPPARQSPQAAVRTQPRIERMSSERWRMESSLLLSLLIHGLLLSLTFSGQGRGLPSLKLPWQERRVEVPELRVVLVPAPAPRELAAVNSGAEPAQQASIEPPVAGGRAPAPPASPAPLRGRALEIAPAGKPKAEAQPQRNAVAAPAKASTSASESGDAVPAKIPKTGAIDVAPSSRPKLVVPPAPTGPDVIAVAPSVSSLETVMPMHREASDLARERIGQDVRERATALAKQADQLEAAQVEAAKREADLREEAARVEVARVETKRAEAAQLAAARQEAERQEAARQEVAARIEAARRAAAQLEAERLLATRQEAARVEAARAAQLESERQEAVRQEAAARIEATRRAAAQLEAERRQAVRQEAAPVAAAPTAQAEAQRQEPARQEARPETARPEAERQEPARPAAAPQEAARGEAEKGEEEKREALRRAIGRQLDEEAAKREAARQLPLSLSTARRARLWGRADPNVELVQYAEGWARKIQFNTPVATVREVAKQPHRQPTVTVAIRSDGSVESVTFVVPSGVAQVDDAIRRIVESHAHYPAFPPALAREYDVIEIRRTWHFNDAVGLY